MPPDVGRGVVNRVVLGEAVEVDRGSRSDEDPAAESERRVLIESLVILYGVVREGDGTAGHVQGAAVTVVAGLPASALRRISKDGDVAQGIPAQRDPAGGDVDGSNELVT